MNPLTQVKNTQKITARELASGVSEQGSWHERFKDSAYINVGLLPFDLTEGDLLAVFAQYGEVVDVNLIRDKATGKSRGFAFLAYEDQRSTVLAVDNLNGASLLGRTIRVDHVANYKKKKEEDEEEEQRKREERGVCYAFQRGECNRGDACKFSHDEKRNANSGWGRKEDGGQNGGMPPPPWKRKREDDQRDSRKLVEGQRDNGKRNLDRSFFKKRDTDQSENGKRADDRRDNRKRDDDRRDDWKRDADQRDDWKRVENGRDNWKRDDDRRENWIRDDGRRDDGKQDDDRKHNGRRGDQRGN